MSNNGLLQNAFAGSSNTLVDPTGMTREEAPYDMMESQKPSDSAKSERTKTSASSAGPIVASPLKSLRQQTIDTLNSLLNAGVPVEDAKREFTKSYFRDGHCCNLNVWDHDWRRASRSQLRNIGIIGSIYATTKRNNETDGAASYGIRADVKRLTGLADTLAECEDLVLAGDVSAVVTALQDSIFKSGNKVDDCKAPDMPLGAWHDLYSNQWVEPQTNEEKLKDSRISCLLGIYEGKLREERQRFAQATANSNAMSEQSKGGWTD